jgi:2Fe-2S ferredoxin
MMPVISFVKNKGPLPVKIGENLMQALLEKNIPVASSCHGEGICRKCVVTVFAGLENLSAPSPIELELAERNPIESNQRISCQVQVLGDITIDTGYW